MKNIILYCICIPFFMACKDDTKNKQETTSFDISSDGNFTVFSQINNNKKSSIYKSTIDGTNTQLLANKNEYSFFYPKISRNGKTVFFIEKNIKETTS